MKLHQNLKQFGMKKYWGQNHNNQFDLSLSNSINKHIRLNRLI
jgi:hypothetical protein